MKLRDRLEKVLSGPDERTHVGAGSPIEEVLPGRDLQTERGSCLCVETRFPVDYMYGHHSLRCVLEIRPEMVCVAGKDSGLVSFDPRACVFFDAETTGLSGGSGTCAFLLGMGYYSGRTFVIRQLFMRDFDEEQAVLSALAESMRGKRFIVTYNGKSFDVPLIESRLIMSRMESVLSEMRHLDLLHAARRVWGKRLSDCRLCTVERLIMGQQRGEDIPGEEIPERFFSFLKNGDASGLPVVFKHNRDDILLLPVLLNEICCAVADAGYRGSEPLDLYCIGKVYDSMKRRDETLVFYLKAMDGLTGANKAVAAWRLSIVYKRLKRWDEATAIWRRLLKSGMYGAYEELAKYYEHTSGELQKAAEVVVRGLGIFNGTKYQGGLEHRLNRIKRRLEDKE